MTECIITSSVLIAVVILLRVLFRGKISRRLQYALWGLVLLRLLLPFSLLQSPISVMNMIPDGATSPQEALNQTPQISTGNNVLTIDASAPSSNISENTITFPAPDTASMSLGEILNRIWLIGAIIAGLWLAGMNIMFYRRLRKTRKAYDAPDCPLPVYVTGQIASPCLFGLFYPAIYLTPKATDSNEATSYVLSHEFCHYRHGDHIWSALRGVCLAAYWWNPLVWAAAFLSRADSELACDEAVLKKIGEEKRLDYGQTLIDMIAVKKAPFGLAYAATTMVSGKRGIKERLNMIIKNPKTFIPALAAVILIVAFCVGSTFTGAKNNTDTAQSDTDFSVYAQQLYDARNPYIGDAPADGKLLEAMGISNKLGSYTLELETEKEPYILRINFTDEITDGAAAFNREMRINAALLLALIDNASQIQWQYRYLDQVAGGGGSVLDSMTLEEAASFAGVADIKSCGQSADGVRALLEKTQTGSNAPVSYGLMKLGKNKEVLYVQSLMAGDEAQLAEDVIMDYMLKSAAWPGVDIGELDECYRLRATYEDGTVSDYYAYVKDGRTVMQRGADGYYSMIDEEMYHQLAALADSASSSDTSLEEIGVAERFAENYMSKDIENFKSYGVTITDSKIINVERLARYEAMTDYPIEVWLLQYRLLPDDMSKVIFAGGMREEDGWITEYGSMGQPCLIIAYKNGKAKYMGNTWTGNFLEEGSRENALRSWLEANGYLPEETYPGPHMSVSFTLSDKTEATLLLSQPVRPGDSTGIWCVERWYGAYGGKYLVTPDTDGLAADYYKQLQQECDNGHRPGLLDPQDVALSYITGVLGQSATTDSITLTVHPAGGTGQDLLDSCVSAAILDANDDGNRNGDFSAESHVTLKTAENGDKTTVYAMALYMEFGYAGAGFSNTGGSHMPVALTFEKNDLGQYKLIEYWEPQDGSYYTSSIKKKFPSDIWDDALDTQKYILAQTQACYQKAVEYGKVSTAYVIENIIETICASPAAMSAPGAYIDAHPIAYRELLYYGDYTLWYAYTKFLQGGQTDLKGHIMLAAMRDLLGDEDMDFQADTGQAWFDQWKEYVLKLRDQNGEAFIKDNMPASWLLLNLMDEQKTNG